MKSVSRMHEKLNLCCERRWARRELLLGEQGGKESGGGPGVKGFIRNRWALRPKTHLLPFTGESQCHFPSPPTIPLAASQLKSPSRRRRRSAWRLSRCYPRGRESSRARSAPPTCWENRTRPARVVGSTLSTSTATERPTPPSRSNIGKRTG